MRRHAKAALSGPAFGRPLAAATATDRSCAPLLSLADGARVARDRSTELHTAYHRPALSLLVAADRGAPATFTHTTTEQGEI